ncbi:hypothetical protein DS832_03900 [Bombilactobacillus bombi]|uniref:Uncharacterized protein n=1 Tax=Bombilactobacillus bombi TaxID=1303590 RepID=A0A3R6Z9H1_9LACO|nr:hypothetical protein [Bombilactobacillus bombi]RHW47302.1 hypothetical protein DS832_03900 [Bombilactobacillus bombi]
MKTKHKAFLLLDNMLGFFLVLQAVAVIPLCIIPTQQKVQQVQQRSFLKLACWQKKQHPDITQITLKNKKYYFYNRGKKLEIYQKNQSLEYDRKQKTFRFFT